jgi:hypothetical protein
MVDLLVGQKANWMAVKMVVMMALRLVDQRVGM